LWQAYVYILGKRVAKWSTYLRVGSGWAVECNSNEKPYHKVYLDAYYIDKNDVTVDEYTKCVNAGGCTATYTGVGCNYGVSGKGDNPINCVTWDQAREYCRWKGGDLPTEAQREKAARGTDGRIYPWGNEWDASKACYNQSSTCAVGSYPQGASPYGVMDMAGNVGNWCRDWYDENYYANSPLKDPQGPDSGQYRVLRGRSWLSSYTTNSRASYRCNSYPSYRLSFDGFRCLRQVSK
jgi:formylglycine-generating enzyme required for sulfatase activity